MGPMSASDVFAVAAARDVARAALLRAFLASGLAFMLGPGTLLGVVNLLQISGREGTGLLSPAWVRAHGHAQVFGWIGSFMLGIGIYSVPSAHVRTRALGLGWAAWMLWTAGVAMQWIAEVYSWQWRVLLPASAVFEVTAFLLFLYLASAHRAGTSSENASSGSRAWIAVVVAGAVAWGTALVLNLATTASLAWHGGSRDVPLAIHQPMLSLITWGVLAPFIWGFSARWMPILLALPPLRVPALVAAVATNVAGILCAWAGRNDLATALAAGAAVLAVAGLRLFERPIGTARTRGVHVHFPLFVRAAYVWLIVAAGLGIAAARWDLAGGIWGASRHAFTVGFAAVMVVAVGQRMLPGFAAHRPLWSPRLMGVALVLLMAGCLLRVSSEVLAYEQYAAWVWPLLPVSGVLELAGLTAFALNLAWTLWGEALSLPAAS